MRITAIFALAAAVVVASCSTPQHPDPAAAASPLTTNYRCESGETIVASYPDTDSAIVRYRAATYRLQIAVSASGARYVGDGLEWWTKGSGAGSEGTLFRYSGDGNSDEPLEFCVAE